MGHIETSQAERANRRYINRSMNAALLTREHERALARRWREHGDVDALHQLVTAHGRLVIKIASRFRHYGLSMSDLVQEGNIGLLQAAARFEPGRDIRFSTYAMWWVRSAMQDYVLRNWSIVRTGTTAAQKALFFNLARLRAKYAADEGGRLTEAGKRKVAEELKVDPAEVEDMEFRLAGADQSLNALIGESSEDQWQDFVPDQMPNPEEQILDRRDAETRTRWLSQALAELSARERTIIRSRRLSEHAVTLEELGARLGISKERVRQIEHKAIEKLRTAMLHRLGRTPAHGAA